MAFKSFKYSLLLALACALSACDDDDKNEGKVAEDEPVEQTKECTGDSKQCDGDFVMMCIDGIWKKNSKACPKGCLDGSCMTTDAVCTDDERRCSGNELQICVNKAWKDIETCTNGCNESSPKCNAASETPVPITPECTDDDTKCLGDSVGVCKDGSWKSDEPCPYGCEAGKCIEKTDAVSDSYCDGQILHYQLDGEAKTRDCSLNASKGLECQLLKDGTSECVYNHETVKKGCKQENQIVSATCKTPEELGLDVKYPFIMSNRCVLNDKGELVGIANYVLSVCGNYNGKDVVLVCNSEMSGVNEIDCENCVNKSVTGSCNGADYFPPQFND